MGYPTCGQTALLTLSMSVFGLAPGVTAVASQRPTNDSGTVQDEASRWLAALRQKGPLTHERVLVVAQSGEILDTVDGAQSRVDFPRRLQPYLADAREPVTLVHNHPAGTGLSARDLDTLARPGVRSIIAVSHDGSFYEASAGPLANPAALEPCLYGRARGALERALKRERPLFDQYAANENHAHLVALVLARAGALEYRATLRGYRLLSWNSCRFVFERAVASAGDEVKKQLGKCGKS